MRLIELLQDIAGLEHLPTEPVEVADDQHVEWSPTPARVEGVHETEKTRTVRKLGAANAVVDVDVRVEDRPALASRVGARVLDLTRDGLLLRR